MPLETIRRIHLSTWKARQSVSPATKTAIQITKQWQTSVAATNPTFTAEYPVEGLGEKIDLVDTKRMIAYELKVSPNNAHMEFYRDVFKVLIHNEQAKRRIKKLIFIVPRAGAERLQRGLGQAACRVSKKFGFSVEVQAL